MSKIFNQPIMFVKTAKLVTKNLMEYPSILFMDIKQCLLTFTKAKFHKGKFLNNLYKSLKEFQLPVDNIHMPKLLIVVIKNFLV